MFSYTRSVLFSAIAFVAGVSLVAPLGQIYLRSGLRLPDEVFPANHMAVTGLLLIIAGIMNFTFTLTLHAAEANVKRRSSPTEGACEKAFGQGYQPTIVDRFGVRPSARQIRRYVGIAALASAVADFGCGYQAAFVRSVLARRRAAPCLWTVALAPDLRAEPQGEGRSRACSRVRSPQIADRQPRTSMLCMSVLEHLWDPLTTAMRECCAHRTPGRRVPV